MGSVIDQDVLRFDRRVLWRELLERVLQQALGELHDVRLGRAVNALAFLGDGEREGKLDDLLTTLARDDLEAFRHAGSLHVLDSGVEILDVLADDDDVEVAPRESSLDPGKLANRTYVAVRLEECAKRDVCASISVADWGFEGTFEHYARALN